MLVVRVELHSAITGKITEIGRMIIANDATGTRTRGNYQTRVFKGRSTSQLDMGVVQRRGGVFNWPRQARHVWNLVSAALTQMGYG